MRNRWDDGTGTVEATRGPALLSEGTIGRGRQDCAGYHPSENTGKWARADIDSRIADQVGPVSRK